MISDLSLLNMRPHPLSGQQGSLSDEVLLNIFSFLPDTKDVANFGAVNKNLHYLSEDHTLWPCVSSHFPHSTPTSLPACTHYAKLARAERNVWRNEYALRTINIPSKIHNIYVKGERLFTFKPTPWLNRAEASSSGLKVYDLQTGTCLSDIPGTRDMVRCIPKNGNLCSLDAAGNIIISEIDTGKITAKIAAHCAPYDTLLFVEERSLLIMAKNNNLKIWNYNADNSHPIIDKDIPERIIHVINKENYIYVIAENNGTLSMLKLNLNTLEWNALEKFNERTSQQSQNDPQSFTLHGDRFFIGRDGYYTIYNEEFERKRSLISDIHATGIVHTPLPFGNSILWLINGGNRGNYGMGISNIDTGANKLFKTPAELHRNDRCINHYALQDGKLFLAMADGKLHILDYEFPVTEMRNAIRKQDWDKVEALHASLSPDQKAFFDQLCENANKENPLAYFDSMKMVAKQLGEKII